MKRTLTIWLAVALASTAAVAEPDGHGAMGVDEDGYQAVASSDAVYAVNQDAVQFSIADSLQQVSGRRLVDIEIRWDGIQERYSGIWYPVAGTVHKLIQRPFSEWTTFLNEMGAKQGRWLDVEVGYFGSDKRYSGIFYEDGDDYSYAIFTTNDDVQFGDRLDTNFADGRQIIDFESYRDPNGDVKYAGVWVDDPNQPKTHLLYGMEWDDISALLDPMQGRAIDVDRYVDEQGRVRYAIILQIQPGGEWGVFHHRDETELGSLNSTISDSNTHLIDVETYMNGSELQHIGVWGNDYKSLNELPPIPSETAVEPLTQPITNLINGFEGTTARVGLFAKNVRTDQSLAWRSNEMFYLASATKTAVLLKVRDEIERGLLHPENEMAYTNGLGTGAPWYMDDRGQPGFDEGVCDNVNDFGGAFTVQEFAQGMMQASDNGATSALVDSPVLGVSYDDVDLNEWLASIPGVGQGWGLVTSIQRVDQALGRFSQIAAQSDDLSLFTAPGHTIRPYLRNNYRRCSGTGVRCSNTAACPLACSSGTCTIVPDPWGDMAAYAAAEGRPIPAPSLTNAGYARYYRTGLNSSTPRALSNLLEKMVERSLLNEENTLAAWDTMDEFAPLAAAASFPSQTSTLDGPGIWVQAKGGTQQGSSAPCTDSATFSMGPDTIVVSVLTKGNNLQNCGPIRSALMSPMGTEVLRALAADLEDCGAATGGFEPSTIRPGDPFEVFVDVCNTGGGDAFPGFIKFYASTDTSIDDGDTFLGTVPIGPISAGSGQQAFLASTLGASAPDDYYIGWIIDPVTVEHPNHGLVGEIDEQNNTGVLPQQITVLPELTTVQNVVFIDEDTLLWSPEANAQSYTVFEGHDSSTALLANAGLDSCERASTASVFVNLPRLPQPGSYLWYLVNAEGDGPIAPGNPDARVLDSTGVCGDSCAHDLCTGTGGPLEPACDSCVAQVCEVDPFCCATNWDFQCVNEVLTVCNVAFCPTAAGSCAHSLCTVGAPLTADCDDPPVQPSCVTQICAVDPYCCNVDWDAQCIGEVTSVCGLACQ